MTLEVFTLRERPGRLPLVFSPDFRPPFWPEYMLHDAAARLYFPSPFLDHYLDFAFAGVEDDRVVARAFSVPFAFKVSDRAELPDGGWDEVIRWAHEDQAVGREPTAVSALEISLLPQARGLGNSRRMLDAMKANARKRGFLDLFAPVRPSHKHHRPFMSMADYVGEVRANGLPEDAWLRVHVRAGGRIGKSRPYAMTISGTVAERSQWPGMSLDRSGPVPVARPRPPHSASSGRDTA